jgi:uncharacterized membrane protein YjjP (DUF1212 family)
MTATREDMVLAAELELGTLLFESGAAGQRVFDSLDLLNDRLAGDEMHVQLSFESILITQGIGERCRTGLKRYSKRPSLNGRVLEEVSRYLHSLPTPADPETVLDRLRSIRKEAPARSRWIVTAGYVGFVVIFGYFNHADAGGLLIIAIAGFIGAFALREALDRGFGVFVPIIIASFLASASTLLLALVIPTDTQLVTMIVPCVFMVPGFQLMNAGWELMRGHEDLGTSRMMYVINAVLAISAGILLTLFIYTPGAGGSGIVIAWPLNVAVDMALACVAALCIAQAFNATREMLVIAMVCAMLGRGFRDVVYEVSGEVTVAVFCGCAVISIVGLALAMRRSLPVGAILAAASVQFVPGYYYMRTLQGMSEVAKAGPSVSPAVTSSLLYYLMISFFISAAIVLGSLLPRIFLARSRRWD